MPESHQGSTATAGDGHSGGAAFGSSLLLFDPDSGVTLAVVMNQGTGANHFNVAPALLEIATRRF